MPITVVGLAGVALLATGCGGGSSSSAAPSATTSASASATPSPSDSNAPPVRQADADLVIWSDEKRAAALKDVAAKFGADNGIKVAVQVVATDLQTNFVTANTAGNGPDVVVGAHDWIGNLVQNSAIDPLQLTDPQKSAFVPVALKAVTYKDQVYGLPYALESIALYRNTAVVPAAPKTFEDVVSSGLAAVKAKKVQSALNLQVGQNGDAYHMEPLYTSAGGYLFGTNAQGDYDPKDVGVGKAGSIAAAKKIAALGEKGQGVLKRSIAGENSIALFAGGKAAYLVSGPWALADLQKAGIKYDITPIPGFAGLKPARPFTGVQAFYVASKGKNKQFAQEFVTQAVNTPEAMKALFDAEPRPPAMSAVLDQVSGSNPDVAKFASAAKDGQVLPVIPEMAAIWEPLGKAQAAIVGGADPTKTIESAGKTINAAVK
jgi:arabinogalactan oligomer/maltooligosaccharide transport system substrate-binding protein